MLTSARGHNRHRGFTLVEIMVVLVVVGISLALIVPNFMKSDEDVLREESDRLLALIDYAADMASSQGHRYAWAATSSGYRFQVLDDDQGGWQPVTNDDVLRERTLPEVVTVESIQQQGTAQQGAAQSGARVVFSPSGVNPPFRIVLKSGKNRQVISGNLLGQAEVSPPSALEGTPI